MTPPPLTHAIEIDLPEHPPPASALHQWAAELLADVGDRLRELGYEGDPSKPEDGLSYGYHREQAQLLDWIAGPQLDPAALDLVRTAGADDPRAMVPGTYNRALLVE